MSCRISAQGQTFLCNTPTCCHTLLVIVLLFYNVTSPNIYHEKYFIILTKRLTDNNQLSLLLSVLVISRPPAQVLQSGSEERVGPDIGDLTKIKLTFGFRK